jgi:hypothetical protein
MRGPVGSNTPQLNKMYLIVDCYLPSQHAPQLMLANALPTLGHHKQIFGSYLKTIQTLTFFPPLHCEHL